MSTLRLTTISNQTGSSSVPSDTVINGSAKAWVNFNGTGTVAIRASFNVSSITDNGTGYYTMNFTTPMVDANYVCVFANFGRQAGGSYNATKELGYYTSGALASTSKVAGSVALGSCWGALNSFTQTDEEIFEVTVFR